jgi:transcriptional regulator with XRE-family HTH domain
MFPMVDKKDFVSWVQNELKNRNMSQAELARKSGLTRSAINKLVNRQQLAPGNDMCLGIANAFNIPPETVFRKAGILPPKPIGSSFMDKLMHLASQLPEEEIEDLTDSAEAKLERLARKKKKSKPAKSTTSP